MLLLVLIGLTACASTPIVLHPIYPKDIFFIPSGTQCGNIKTEEDGFFMTQKYMGEVMKARVDGK
jgi:hypothetical protein